MILAALLTVGMTVRFVFWQDYEFYCKYEPVMGTVFSIVADDGSGIPAAVARLHDLDAKFSTYRPDSAISPRAIQKPHGVSTSGNSSLKFIP